MSRGGRVERSAGPPGGRCPSRSTVSPPRSRGTQLRSAAGFDGFAEFFRALCETVPDEMIDPASIALLRRRSVPRVAAPGCCPTAPRRSSGVGLRRQAGTRRPRCFRRLHRYRVRKLDPGRTWTRGPRWRAAGSRSCSLTIRWSASMERRGSGWRPCWSTRWKTRPSTGPGVVGLVVTERAIIAADRGLGLELARRYASVATSCGRAAVGLARRTGSPRSWVTRWRSTLPRWHRSTASPVRSVPTPSRPHQQRWRRRPCTRRARRRA